MADPDSMRPRFLVVPGWVTSKNDGQRHWIGVTKLVRLYGLQPHEYVTSSRGYPEGSLVTLRPRYDGNYRKPRTS